MSRRKMLEDAVAELQNGRQGLEDLKFEYEEWRDNMPENLEGSATYEKLDETIDTLDNAVSEIDAQIEELESLDLPQGFGRD